MRRLSYPERRRLVDYIQATENEIALDSIALELAGIAAERCGYFPRASKWINYVAKWRRLLRVLWIVAAPAWRLGGAAAYHTVECVRFHLHVRRCRAASPRVPAPAEQGYVLALTSRAGEIVRPPGIPNVPQSWLTVPWAPVLAPQESTTADLFGLLGTADLLRCLRYSVLATRQLGRRPGTRAWVLQSYTAFRWFAVRIALEATSGDLLMTQHFDRWAILVDRVVLAKRRARGSPIPTLTLVQHGEIGGLSPQEWRTGFYARMQHKLQAVSMLYAYDRRSEEIFRSSLLSASCARGVRASYYQPKSIVLRPGAPQSGCRVLFVGHPVCEALHVHVLEKLMHEKPLEVFYKPHPKARMGRGMAGHAWSIIEGTAVFPAVDLLISYPSTLVAEYAALGIPAVVHPLDLTVAKSEDFVAEVRNRVRALVARHAQDSASAA
jgi:hypothetical protein